MFKNKVKKILTFDYNAISLPVLAGYLALSFAFSDFGFSAVIAAALLCAWAGICGLSFIFVKKFKLERRENIHWLILAFNVVIILYILLNFSFGRTIVYYALLLTLGNVLFWISSPISDRTVKVTKYILIGVALLFAGVNLLYSYFPKQVRKIAFAVLTDTSKAYNERLFLEGYGYSFGEDIGMTAHIIALGLALVWFSHSKKNWKTHAPMLLLLAFGLFSTQRRGETFIWLFAILLATAARLWKLHKQGKIEMDEWINLAICAGCVLLAVAIFYISVPATRFDLEQYMQPNNSETMSGSESSSSSDSGGVHIDADKLGNGRLALWRLAWAGFLEKPVFGHGWGAFAEIAPLSGNTQAINAHCVYLQLLCETGFVGFLLIGSVFVCILLLIIQKLVKETNEINIVGLCILLAMLGLGLIDNSLYKNYWIQTFQIMLFFVFAPKQDKGIEKQEQEEISVGEEE